MDTDKQNLPNDPGTAELERVEIETKWFKLKIEEINWKTIVIVAMLLGTLLILTDQILSHYA